MNGLYYNRLSSNRKILNLKIEFKHSRIKNSFLNHMRNCFISSVDYLTFSTAEYLFDAINHAFRSEIGYLQKIKMSGITKRKKLPTPL